MSNKLAILRGINVGGKRKILMADLKSLCEKLGWKEVSTYIQSGNVIFKSEKENEDLGKELTDGVLEQFGFEVPVLVRNSEEFQNSIEKNPFYNSQADITKLHLTFLKENPQDEDLQQIKLLGCEPDQFAVDGKDVFIYCEGKYHQSKLTNNFFEKKLKVGATTRNWKTVLKLLDLASE
ncbi:Uncharacterized conserved protein, DUF1697 family [Marivirga sericea]|uniref:Uncharacterized conserved protein, DUF1697 family n=1 Tax=Marivirga sericea TaxID=1028 RepID=A0A1X7L4Y1_9BACT|nr:DUF1697 domain-containing protein [Marivirga sericea]SMG48820.1 Uncharacterized conserved protein, DUF1697 family [Marivirga sericea]